MRSLIGQADTIITMYNEGVRIYEIATEYGVADTTIQRFLHRNGIPTPRRNVHVGNRKSKYKMQERVFSPEFLARQKENTRVNDDKIQYIQFKNTIEDQILVTNILSRPIIG